MSKRSSRSAPPQYTPITRALTAWLPPLTWRQLTQAHGRPPGHQRWSLHALVTVLALMAYAPGHSEAERFLAARAFYVACHQHGRRPGRSLAGFHKALAKLPLALLRRLPAAVRRRILQRFGPRCRVAGFLLFAGDGSRLECPRSAELERRLGQAGKPDSAPTRWLTALVLVPAGPLWSWRLGQGTASEQDHVRRLVATLPPQALLVLDAAFVSYELYQALLEAGVAFVVRMSSRAYLYTHTTAAGSRRDQAVCYWPAKARRAGRPPVAARLVRVRGKKQEVWLLTSVRDRQRLSAAQVAQIYRWRWKNEGLFRTSKRTLAKFKLTGRTVALVHREAEGSLLALQVLLAQDVRVRRDGGRLVLPTGSARCALLAWRGALTLTLGACLGPRQQRQYQRALRAVQRRGRSQGARKTRRAWPRRRAYKPPKPPQLRPMPPDVNALFKRFLHVA